MVKFSREYEASIIPEWKATFVDYKGLKKLVKRIKIARRDAAPPLLAGREAGGGGTSSDGGGSNASSGSYGFSVLDPVRALAAHFAATPASPEGGDGNDDQPRPWGRANGAASPGP